MALGLAQAAYEAASAYARERKQFGRAIASFQGVAFQIADMATEIDAARLLVYRAAWLKDQRSEEHTSELQSLMRTSYAVFCLKKKKHTYARHKAIKTHI